MTGHSEETGATPERSASGLCESNPRRVPTNVLLGTAVLTVIVDAATKLWAVAALVDGPVDVWWTLRLALVENTGVAFGAGRGLGPVLAVVAVAVAVVVWRMRDRFAANPGPPAVGMVLGGAVGNLLDRLLRGPGWGRGGVVDFIDLQFWPVFNVADIAITVGVALLLLAAWRADRQIVR